MNKLLAITILNLSIFGCNNSVLANDLTCSDDKNSEVIKIFYNLKIIIRFQLLYMHYSTIICRLMYID